MDNQKFYKCLEFYDSLLRAVKKAGGHTKSFSVDNLKEMKIFDFMDILATNNIRFVHIDPDGKEKNDGDFIITKEEITALVYFLESYLSLETIDLDTDQNGTYDVLENLYSKLSELDYSNRRDLNG